jgi:hypothetical protein
MANGGRPSPSILDARRSSLSPVILVAGDKCGGVQNRFYKQLIATADQRFSAHLED